LLTSILPYSGTISQAGRALPSYLSCLVLPFVQASNRSYALIRSRIRQKSRDDEQNSIARMKYEIYGENNKLPKQKRVAISTTEPTVRERKASGTVSRRCRRECEGKLTSLCETKNERELLETNTSRKSKSAKHECTISWRYLHAEREYAHLIRRAQDRSLSIECMRRK
jgi:hypothetical protein